MRAEQDVKRLRKPEDVAQPGQVNPVLVAVRTLKRREAVNPMEGWFVPTADDSSSAARAGKQTRFEL
jgi:hypothetical protein